MSKGQSRAKRKRRQRAQAGTPAPGARATGNGAAPAAAKGGAAKAREGVKARDGAKAGGGAAGAKARGGAAGAKARGGAAGAKARDGAKARAGAGGPKARGAASVPARRPDPIWAPFPLTEIGMGVGIVIFGVGYLSSNTWLVSVGALVLGVVVGELCLREHFGGFRSHALLLAALVVVTAHSLAFAISDAFRSPITLAVDLAVGGALAWWLRGRFRAARERATATRSTAPRPPRRVDRDLRGAAQGEGVAARVPREVPLALELRAPARRRESMRAPWRGVN